MMSVSGTETPPGGCSPPAGGHALYERGDLRATRRWAAAAYQEAAGRGDGVAMACAALGFAGLWAHEHRTAADSAKATMWLLDALRRVEPRSPLALRLRIRLAAEEDYRAGTYTAVLGTLAEARRAGDPVPLAEALSLAHHCLLGPAHAMPRAELARELIGTASKTGRRGDLLMGVLWLGIDLLLGADPQAERHLAELRALLEEGEFPAVGFALAVVEVMQAIRAGRFDQAERLAAVCAERGAAAGDVTAKGSYAAQLGVIRWYQGRVGELVPELTELVGSVELSVADNAAAAGLALAAAAAGDHRLARSVLARLRPRVLGDGPRSGSWLVAMAAVVETAHLLGDRETAERAAELLAPYAELPAMLTVGVVCLGSVHHSLGLAALTAGDPDTAVRRLRAAVDGNLALGHWPAVAGSRFRLGQALALRDGPRDEAARRELALARQEAGALGMVLPSGPVPGRASSLVTCRAEGGRWRLGFGGRSARVDHCVGLRHLAHLLANPGTEISAIDLAAGPGAEPAGNGVVSAQPVLDEVAKREYRERLDVLRAEIDECEAAHRFDRAEQVRAERDWLVSELASAAGLAGRTRGFADSGELARIAVGKAIRRALKRVTEADPVIGAELRATLRTGLTCCYQPR